MFNSSVITSQSSNSRYISRDFFFDRTPSNTAQCLTSLSEALQDDRSEGPREDSLKLLEESLELFQRCLTLQEYNYAESQAGSHSAPEDDMSDTEEGGASISDSQPPPQDDRWATILEPITNDTLLDTVLAQLETLTTLSALITGEEGGRGLAWIEEYSTNLMNSKLPAYVLNTDREEEAALTRANFIAALADANFRTQRIDSPTYERALSDAYSPLDISLDPEGLCDKAEALLAYNSSLRLFTPAIIDASSPAQKAQTSSRWKALTAALEVLTSASKIPTADNLPKIHLTRGDVELLRCQLGQAPTLYEPASKNTATLLKNAGTFYKGAMALAAAAGPMGEKEVKEATVKMALVASLGGMGEELKRLVKVEPGACERVLEEAVEEGLITLEWLAGQGFSVA